VKYISAYCWIYLPAIDWDHVWQSLPWPCWSNMFPLSKHINILPYRLISSQYPKSNLCMIAQVIVNMHMVRSC